MIKSIFWDYLLLFYLVAATGFLAFFAIFQEYAFLLFPLVLIIYCARGYMRDTRMIYLLVGLLVFLTMQTISHDANFVTMFSIFVRLSTYLLCGRILLERFPVAYDNLITFICIISLVLWSGCQLSSAFNAGLYQLSLHIPQLISYEYLEISTNPARTLWLYTLPEEYTFRNSGPFFEPGMFAVFIIIGIVRSLYSAEPDLRRLFLYFCTMLTTCSTTGYMATLVALMPFLMLQNFSSSKSFSSFIILLAKVAIPIAIVMLFDLNFMSDKISDDLANIDYSYSRFGSILYHWEFISKYPLLGIGFQGNWEIDTYVGCAPNGLTNIIRTIGIPLSIFYYYYLYKSVKWGIFKGQARFIYIGAAFCTLLIVAFAQDVTTRPFFYMMIAMGFCGATIHAAKVQDTDPGAESQTKYEFTQE